MNRYYFKVNCFNDVALKVSNAVPENSKVKSNLVRVQQNSVVQSTEHIQCSSGPGLGLRTFKISRSVSNLGPDLRVQRCCESALRWINSTVTSTACTYPIFLSFINTELLLFPEYLLGSLLSIFSLRKPIISPQILTLFFFCRF